MSDKVKRDRRASRRKSLKRKRGVPFGITVMIGGLCAAVAFSCAYLYAMKTFNSKVTDLSEKQAMFTKLYEIDSAVRENYSGNIDEEKLKSSLSRGYAKGIDKDKILYVPSGKYSEEGYKDYKAFKISDGSYVLIKKSCLIADNKK